MTRHRVEVIAAFVLGAILALSIAGPVQGRPSWFCERKPDHHLCAAPTSAPTVRVTERPTVAATVPVTPAPTLTPTKAPTAAPTATVAPTATPAAPGPSTRPFPAPVTSRTVKAPTTICDGADDHRALNDFIAGVPNGSVIDLRGLSCSMAEGIMLGNRQHLVFELGTSEFRLAGDRNSHFSSAFIPGYSYQSRSFVGGAAHLAFRGGRIIGNDPCPGCPQPLRGENQQAVRCNGSDFIEVTGMVVTAVSGDGAFFDNCDDVWVHHNHVVTAGRNGLTVIKGQRVLGEDNRYDDVGYAVFDLEPNFSHEASADITFRRNFGGDWQNGIGLVSVDGAGTGADIRRVRIEDITAGLPPQVYVNQPRAGRPQDVTVIRVTGPAGGVIRILDTDGVTVYGNSAPVTTTGSTNVRTAP